jgi:feruloyl-CoA synthase
VLVFPDLDACRTLAPDLAKAGPADLVNAPAVRAEFQARLDTFAAAATGSSNRIVALVLLADLPSLDAGEITDKGSINQRAVLRCRQALVADLYAPAPPPHVIVAETRADHVSLGIGGMRLRPIHPYPSPRLARLPKSNQGRAL